MKTFEKEALQYDLLSLVALQTRRKNNISLFEKSIKEEREISSKEEIIQEALESKLRLHDTGRVKLDASECHLIQLDLPKIKSTREKREQTIKLLKNAIIAEQTSMDYEERMIAFLESNGNKK